jgi:hypothetical protein
MSKASDTIYRYIWWTYPRGNFHYDVMVTLILAFIFITPLFVNFGDKPTLHSPHQTEVVVIYNGAHSFIYQVDASVVNGTNDESIRESLMQVVEPIAGEARIDHYQVERDRHGHPQAYKVWVQK